MFLLSTIGVVLYFVVKRMFGKKVEEYWRQTISANPEYLSQMELYKADEWELKREEIVLEEEIGRGTFGKVCILREISSGHQNIKLFRFFVAMQKRYDQSTAKCLAIVQSKLCPSRPATLNDCTS